MNNSKNDKKNISAGIWAYPLCQGTLQSEVGDKNFSQPCDFYMDWHKTSLVKGDNKGIMHEKSYLPRNISAI